MNVKKRVMIFSLSLILCANSFLPSAGAAYEHDRNLITDELEEMTYQFFLDHMEDFAQGKSVEMKLYFYNETEEEDLAQWNHYKRETFFKAFEDFDNDHPENFFTAPKMRNIHGRVGSGGAWIETFDVYPHISFNWRPVEDGGLGWDLWADYQFLKNKVAELVAECRAAGPSRYDQLLYLHDWLIMNNAYNKPCYDAEMKYGETLEEWPDVTPHVCLSAFREDLSPVCDGYAFAFKVVCNALDIPCIATPGVGFVTMPDGSMGMHRWNYVQMEDDKWYLVDVTWDDPIPSIGWNRVVSGYERHTYFLRGEGESVISRSYPTDLYASNDYYPVISKTDYDPATKPSGEKAYVSIGVDPDTAGLAYASTQLVNIDGRTAELQAYALADANGNRTNYVKVRDVADALDGTASQFNVGWTGAVDLQTGVPYTSRNGQDNQTPYSGDRTYTKATAETKVNGVTVPLKAFLLTDDDGGAYTYYKLRDLGHALGFNVGWSTDKGVFIETGKPYDVND